MNTQKKKAMTILYEVYDNLYVNLTNKCPCACTFCLRQTRDHMEHSGVLWLERDVTEQELITALEKTELSRYHEIVFCGFGEPTEALEVLLAGADYIKKHSDRPVRINTNGMGNLVNGRDITPEFAHRIDTVSISLNTPNAKKYQELVRSRFGEQSFESMLDFAEKCTRYVPHVVMTTVATTLSREEEEQCAIICQKVGADYRIRPWED